MSEFYVEWKKIRGKASDIEGAKRMLKNAGTSLESIKSNLNGLGKYTDITNTLTRIGTKLEKQEASAEAMAKAIELIANKYENTENEIIGASPKKKSVKQAKNKNGTGNSKNKKNAKKNKEEKVNAKWAKRIKDAIKGHFGWRVTAIGEFGVIGAFIAAFGEPAVDGVNFDTLLGAGSKFVQSFGALLENAYADESDVLKVLTGLKVKDGQILTAVQELADEKFLSSAENTKWYQRAWASIKEQDVIFAKKTKVSEKIGVATKWAGHALTVVTSAVDNYKEHGKTDIRFWGETAIESATTIITGAAATAAATALLGTAAPAVVCTAVGAVALWAVDEVVYGITGKNIAEHVSDGIIDGIIGKVVPKWA